MLPPLRQQHRARRFTIGTAVGALVAAGALTLVAAPPAQAADKTVPGHLVDTSETRATGHNVFGELGVRVYTEGATSTDKAAGYFDVNKSLATTAATEPVMTWSRNDATTTLRPGMQLKVDFDDDGDIDGILVGEPVYADGSPLYGNDWWLSNNSAQFVKDAAPVNGGGFGSQWHGTLAQWSTAFPGGKVIQAGWSLGSGVKGDGTILKFAVAGDTYFFSPAGTVTTTSLSSAQVAQGETRSQGSNTFLPNGGVEVQTVLAPNPSEAKAAGYFVTNQPLVTAGEPSMVYHNISGIPAGLQLVVDFDGNGTPDGILVGERSFYGTDWWASNNSAQFVKDGAPSHSSGFGSLNHGQLSEWRDNFPNAVIVAGGWSLGSGVAGHGVIESITIGLNRYTFNDSANSPYLIVEAKVSGPRMRTVALKGQILAPLPSRGRIRVFENGVQIKAKTTFSRKFSIGLGSGITPGTHTYTVTFADAATTVVVQVG